MRKITFVPYTKSDGIPTFRNSEITNIYTRVIEEGWGTVMFDDGYIQDAQDFVQYVTSTDVMFWGIYYRGELIGFCYVNRIEKTYAYLHIGFFKNWWGTEVIITAGLQVLEMLLVTKYKGHPLFKMLMGMYAQDNKHIFNYGLKLGVTVLGEVPNFFWSVKEEKAMPSILVYITKETIKMQLKEE